MHQKTIFLDGEADQWYLRNASSTSVLQQRDFLTPFLEKLPLAHNAHTNVLEIGCGQGTRIKTLSSSLNWSVTGIDPSQLAIDRLTSEGIKSVKGTADNLPFHDKSFDLVIFGFCLYLCDSTDLFCISSETHRVLKDSAWIAILDFWNPDVKYNSYCHADGVFSRKQNYAAMFSWHPDYIITDHCLRDHGNFSYTDNLDDWISATIIRKNRFLMP